MTWPHPSIHPPIHPSTNYTPTHGWESLHRFQIFKQNWNILISSSAIEFWLIPGVPLEEGWVDGGGGWWEGVPYTHAHACACTHVHTHVHTYDIIGNSQGFPQWGLPFAIEIIMFNVYMCVCAHAYMHMHVHVCGGHPPTTPHTHPPTPHLQSCREPKTPKFNKSWTNQDNSILFEDSLPLNTPELI